MKGLSLQGRRAANVGSHAKVTVGDRAHRELHALDSPSAQRSSVSKPIRSGQPIDLDDIDPSIGGDEPIRVLAGQPIAIAKTARHPSSVVRNTHYPRAAIGLFPRRRSPCLSSRRHQKY